MKQLFNNINNKKKAFTLIELLIVIAIIGILSGAVIVAMSGTQESAIDSRIKASMAQLRSSIEIYGLVNGANYTGLESDSEISLLIDDIESQVGTPTVNISGSGDRYCLSTNLKSSNELWCIDSAGFAGLGGCINYSCDTSLGYSSGGIPISTGLVGYWTMDEDSLLSSNTIRDYSPYGNTGTIYGATFATDRHGQSNSAMSFDGVNDYINCGSGNSLQMGTESITISMWIKINSWPTDHYGELFYGGATGGVHGYGMMLHTSVVGRVYLEVYGSLNGRQIVNAYNSVDVGRWTHIVATFNGVDNYIKFHKNGVEILNSPILDPGTVTNPHSFIIGRYYSDIYQFNGLIDDVRIYNRALSAEEIAFLYNSSR